jgi:hypothetical protein
VVRLAQPVAQHVGLARADSACSAADVRRHAHPARSCCASSQQDRCAWRRGRAAAKVLANAGNAGLQRRQQARADAVAGVALVGVAGVFHPGWPRARSQSRIWRRRAPPAAGDARSTPPRCQRRHGGQPGHAGAARKRQQQGFDLVVGMLRNAMF